MIRAALALTVVLLSAGYANAQDGEGSSSRTGAGLFVEPMVTYQLESKTTTNWPTPFSDSTGSVKGFGLGARLGFHVADIVFLGVDGRYAMPQFKDSSVNYDADATVYNYAATVGIQTPVAGLRVWGSYIFGGELDPKASGNFDVKLTDATGYRIGAGFYVAMVSLNLEYQDLKYDKLNLQSLGSISTNTNVGNVSLQDKAWIASVSFPITL